MYTGEVDVISNRATWASQTYELEDDADGTITDLTDPLLTVDIVVTIKERKFNGAIGATLATASLANGKVTIPGPGFQWQFEDTDLTNLCADQYVLGVKITIDDFVSDIIIGTLSVLDGN